jgi:hypothetical protein
VKNQAAEISSAAPVRRALGDPLMTEIPARRSVVTLGARDSSRALADRQLADAVLEQGLHNVLALLGRAQS